MTRTQRRTHFIMWLIITPMLVVLGYLAIQSSSPMRQAATQAETEVTE